MENAQIKTVDLNNRLLKIQEEIQSITKDKDLTVGKKFEFVSDKRINETFKPLFEKYEILFYMEALDYQIKEYDKVVNRGRSDQYVETECLYIVKCNAVFESSEEKKVIPFLGADKNGYEDGLQGAITNARRTFLLKFFNVIQNDKNSGNQGGNNQQGRNQPYQKQTPPPQLSEADLLIKKMNESKTLAEYNSIFDRVMSEGEKDKSIKKIYLNIAENRGYEYDKSINKFRKKDD